MSPDVLAAQYRAYIKCLNRQDWQSLGEFVHDGAVHNGRQIGLAGYRDMLEGDFIAIPDLRFTIELLVAQLPYVSSRLVFECTPVGTVFDLPVNGRRVKFHENVIYRFEGGRIAEVWSVIDTQAIAQQLAE